MFTTRIDVLEQKRRDLFTYTEQYKSAVQLVTDTVERLSDLSEKISDKIDEIDNYKAELEKTRDELSVMKAKNDRVAANFKALLEE